MVVKANTAGGVGVASRSALRWSIGQRLGVPFFERYGLGTLTATGGTTTTLIDTANLLQTDNFWTKSHLWHATDSYSRVISAFSQSAKTLTWLEPAAAAVTSGDEYEIWSRWSAPEVHAAINRALRDAWPYFFTVNDGYLVIQDDLSVNYDLTGLTPTVKRLAAVFLEYVSSDITGQSVASPGAQDYLKDTSQTFTSDHVGWQVRIYKGTSAGDYRTVSALVDSNTLQVSANFTSTLDATSYYRLVDVNEASAGYIPFTNWRLNQMDAPTILRLANHPQALEGYLLRLVYEAEFPDLSGDSSTTTCPQEYIELAAIARLLADRMAQAPYAEVQALAAMQATYVKSLERYVAAHKWQHMAGQITNDQRVTHLFPSDWPF